MDCSKKFYIKHTTNTTRALVDSVKYKINVNTMEKSPADHLELNEIGCVTFSTGKELFFDAYKKNKQTGAFILIDPITNNTSAVGMIVRPVTDNERSVESDIISLNLQELGISPEHYDAVEKVCKEVMKRGIEIRVIK